MGDIQPFPKALQSEYDPDLVNVVQRKRNAKRLYKALASAGLWRDDARMLDVGSGTGLLVDNLGEDVQFCVACDLRRELYLQSRQRIDHVVFVQADGCVLPFPNDYFGMVTCLAVIGEFPDWQASLEEMGRCVAPNGILYVTVANGRFLLKIYTLAEKIGFRIRKSWWTYARACLRIIDWKPENGMGALSMAGWRFINVTPYLAQSQWPWLIIFPAPILSWIMRLFAPSYGFAWQRTSDLQGI